MVEWHSNWKSDSRGEMRGCCAALDYDYGCPMPYSRGVELRDIDTRASAIFCQDLLSSRIPCE